MASLKQVKNKIASVQKTKQITRAMNMVASAKLRKAQARIEKFRPYAEKYYEMLGEMASGTDPSAHPLLEKRDEVKNVGIFLMTADRGLCGAFNNNLIQTGLNFAKERQAQGQTVKFYTAGRKATSAIKKSEYELVKEKINCMDYFDFTLANEFGTELISAYTDKSLDEVHIVYGRFINVVRQIPTPLKILPVGAEAQEEEQEKEVKKEESSAIYLYEPSIEGILGELLPRFVKVQVYRGLLETSASEHAARMTSMDNATSNCEEMISNLTLTYNKARQAAITSELLDIVGGAEALKG